MDQTVVLIAGDPADSGDAFGLNGCEANLDKKEIRVKYARQWTGIPFSQVAYETKPLWKSVKPTIFALETNYKGTEVLREFKLKGIPVMGIKSVNRLTEENRSRWDVMEKKYTVEWVIGMIKEHRIKFPKDHSIYMQMLISQIQQIRRYRTPSGETTYRAMNNRHDDLFMAFLINCHLARLYMEMQ